MSAARRAMRTCAIACAGLLALAMAASAQGAFALSVAAEESLPAPAAVSTSGPTLAGTPVPGKVLTCSTGAWSGNPSSFSYMWRRDGAPIPGQSASSYAVQGADRGHALSCTVTAVNQGGEYLIRGLPGAPYEVQFSPPYGGDYLSQAFNEKPIGEGAPVVTTAGATTAGISASLRRGGQISGKVTAAATGIPLNGVEVCATGAATKSTTCAYSGSTGEYVVSGLPADSYQVEFQTFEPTQNYAPQFYVGKTKASEATPVQVAAGATTAGVNAALTAGGVITGTVTEGEGPAAGVEVCAYSGFQECTRSDSLGKYTLTNFPTGKYKVGFNPVPEGESLGGLFGSENGQLTPPKQSPYLEQYYNGKSAQEAADEIPVEAGVTTSGINAALQTGGSIAGIVVAKEGGARVAQVIVCAEAEKEPSRCTVTSGTGEYQIEGVAPSAYEVTFWTLGSSFFGYGNYAPQHYKDREVTEEGEPVTVKQNVTTAGVNGELLKGAQISGKVTAASSGAAVPGSEVCASGAAPPNIFAGCGLTNGSGEYAITGVPTSAYFVFFLAPEKSDFLAQGYNNKPTAAGADKLEVTVGHSYPGINAALQVGARISGSVSAADTGAPISGARVCARAGTEFPFSSTCAETQSAGPAGSATSQALAVPPAGLSLAKGVSVSAKTGALTFTLTATDPGTLNWNLVFRNSDVGFADSLGISRSRCRAGFVRHKGRCVHATVAFAKGGRTVPAGTAKVTVRPTAKALRALRSGHTLHVSGAFVYRAASGPSVTRKVSVAVRLPRHRKR